MKNKIYLFVFFLIGSLIHTATLSAQSGEILNFDGIDDYGDMGDVIQGLDELSMEVWVNPASVAGIHEICYKDAVSSFNINAGQICVAFGDGANWYSTTYCSNNTITANTWSHVAFSADGDSIRIFINGVLDFAERFDSIIGGNTNSRYLGAAENTLSVGTLTDFFDGSMEEFRIWQYGRCETEIANDYNCILDGAATLLPEIYYSFDQGTAGADNTGEPAILDFVGSFEDATFNGFTLNGATSNFITGSPISATCTHLDIPHLNVFSDVGIIRNGETNASTGIGTDFGISDGVVISDTFYLVNNGSADLTISNAFLTSQDGTDTLFNIVNANFPITVPPFGEDTLFIDFLPIVSDTANAIVHLTTDDCEDTDFTFAIKGESCIDPLLFSVVSTNSAICIGDSTTIELDGELFNSGQWAWLTGLGDDPFHITTDTFIKVAPTTTTKYYLGVHNSCSFNTPFDSITIVVNPQPTGGITSSDADNIICEGDAVTLTGTGGTSYEWSTTETTAPISVSPTITTTYMVTVTDINFCKDTVSQIITVNPPPTASISSSDADNTICSGESVTLTASGGTSYSWSTTETTTAITVNPTTTTTYTVTVTDANGCTDTESVTITINLLPTASISSSDADNIICEGESVTLTASGGTSYSWSTTETTTAITVNPTTTTTYTVTVTDANGCTDTENVTITVNPNPTASISSSDADNTICNSESVTLTAAGGTSYSWSTTETTAAITVNPTTTTTYTVTVTDANGCTNTENVTITVNPNPTASISSSDADNTICEGESVTLTASGGTSYSWSTTETTAAITVNPTTTTTYTVTVTDANGCTDTENVTITVNPNPTASISSSDVDNTICEGESVILTASGGTSYSWSTTETTAAITVNPTTTTTYTVTVTDANGCTDTENITITVNPNPTVSITSSDANNTIFVGESVTLTANGANTYIWSTTETTTSITVSPTTTTTYTVTGTDANGCTNTATVTITVLPTSTVTISSSDVDNIICDGESVTLTASGSNTYVWSTGATTAAITVTPSATTTYKVVATATNGFMDSTTVTITVNPTPTASIASSDTDNSICEGENVTLTASGGTSYSWSTTETTTAITVNPTTTTTYTVTVTDANGCTDTESVTITINPNPTASISSSDADNIICEGESVTLTASGGTSYSWSTTETTAAITVNPITTTTYTVTVTDANGCTDTENVTITVNPLPTASISSSDADNIICIGDSVTLTASGGVSYAWSTAATTAVIKVVPSTTTNYTVTVTDANGCTNTAVQTITVNPQPTGGITAVPNVPICPGDTVTLTGTGGVSYLWATNETTTTIKVTPTILTTYGVTVTDANGCKDTVTTTIMVNPAPTASIVSSDADNIICSGESVTLTASGTTTGTYAWSTTETTAAITVNPTTTTTYTVIVTDGNGCTDTENVTITVNPLPTISISSSDPNDTIFVGESITLTASGANSYLWSTTETTTSITVSPTTTTTYTVTGTDANGCMNIETITITVLPVSTITVASSDADNIICDGESVTLTASGSNIYVWSTGAATAAVTVTPSTTTTYKVVATATNGSMDSTTVTITVNPLPTASIASDDTDNTICVGDSVTLTASGGVNYVWSTTETTAAIKVAPSTTTNYTVTVMDANGCTNTAVQSITVNPLPTIAIASSDADNIICNGESVTLTASGGSSYTWSTAATTTAITVFPTTNTTYTVVGTNTNGCIDSTTVTIIVNPNPTASIASSDADNVICAGDVVTLTGSGGLSYNWSTTETTASIMVNPMATTTYNLTVTDGNGCTDTESVTITVNPLPTASIASSDADNTICNGESVTLTASGGTNYSWSTTETTAAITVNPMTTTVYTVTVTDANGCIDTENVTITVNPLPTASIVSSDVDNIICEGESVILTASGGTSYSWSTTETTMAITVNPTTTTTYTVTVTDANGCTDTENVTITVNPLPIASITSSDADNVICAGESVTLTASGGTNYSWSTAETTAAITVTPATTTTYIVTVTNANGCMNTENVTITVNPLPIASISSSDVDNIICEGESITLTASGGTNYSWSTTETTAAITVTPTTTTTYIVTVTNANGCMNTENVTITVNPLPIASITSSDADNIICAGESVTLTASGGTNYSWSNTATSAMITVNPLVTTTYTVTVTDGNGCTDTENVTITVNPLPTVGITSSDADNIINQGDNVTLTASGGGTYLWSTSAMTNSITVAPLTDSTFTVVVTNGNGCMNSASVTITVINPLVVSITSSDADNVICVGESVTLTGQGGTGYTWSTTETTAAITVTPLATTTYKVTATNSSGAVDSAQVTITVNPLPIVNITSSDPNNALCLGENVTLTAIGGTSYVWSNTQTSAAISVSPITTTTYHVTVTDGNNCVNVDSQAITINTLPTITATSNSPLCAGQTLQLNETGGDASSWTWSGNGLNANIQNPTQIPIASGTYKIIGTDVNNCMDSTTIAVVVNTLPTITATSNSPLCVGQTLQLNETGGDATSWIWSGNGLNVSIQNPTQIPTASGTYKVIGTDANNCIDSTTIAVTVNPLPTITATSNDPLCVGQTLQLNETGGDATSWTWSGNGLSSNTQNPTQIPTVSGTYKVIGTDVNNCIDSATIGVVVNALPTVNATSNAPLCVGQTLQLNETGGDAISWTWSGNGLNTNIQNPTQIPTASGNYTVIGTDANNCIDSATIAVIVNPIPTVTAVGDTFVCSNEDLQLNETGGNAATWNWTGPNGFTNATQNPLINNSQVNSGAYIVTVTDANNCTNVDSVNVTVALGQAFVSNFLTPGGGCIGDTLHFIEISQTNLTPTSILWDFGDGTTSTDRDPTHVYATGGLFNVKVTVTDQQCGNLSLTKPVEINNCFRIKTGTQIVLDELYPNPATDRFTVKIGLIQDDDVIIELFDLNGQLMESRIRNGQSLYVEQFEPTNPGVYFVKIRAVGLGEILTKRVVFLRSY